MLGIDVSIFLGFSIPTKILKVKVKIVTRRKAKKSFNVNLFTLPVNIKS